jgi:PAS domain S-box-containing protein
MDEVNIEPNPAAVLRENARLRALLESSADGVALLDERLRVTYLSDGITRMLGIPVASVVGRRALDSVVIHPEDRAGVERRVRACLSSRGATLTSTVRVLHPDGTWRWIEASAVNRLDDSDVSAVVVSFRDITAWQQEQENTRKVIAGARCLLWDATVTLAGEMRWDIRVFDEAAAQQFLPLDVPEGRTYADAWHSAKLAGDLPAMYAHADDALRSGRTRYANEYRCVDRYGVVHWLYEDVFVEATGTGRWRLVGVCTDITDVKRAHAALERRARLQDALAAISKESVRRPRTRSMADRAVRTVASVLDMSTAVYLELLPSGDEFLLRASSDWERGVSRPARVPAAGTMAAMVVQARQSLVVPDLGSDPRFAGGPLGKSGAATAVGVLVGSAARPAGVLGAYSLHRRDISSDELAFLEGVANVLASAVEGRRAERVRDAQEVVARALVEATTVEEGIGKAIEGMARHLGWDAALFWHADPGADTLVCADVWVRHAGTDWEFAPRQGGAVLRVGEDMPGEVAEARAPRWVLELRDHDGSPRCRSAAAAGYRSAFVFPVVDSGELLGAVELFDYDVRHPDEFPAAVARTMARMLAAFLRRMETERALRRSEARLAEAQMLAHFGDWEYDPQRDRALWSDELYRIVGRDPGDTSPLRRASFLDRVHPADQKAVLAALSDATRRHVPFGVEHRIVRDNGGVRTVHLQGRAVYDATGRPVRVVGTVQDVTERRRDSALRRVLYDIAEAVHTTSDLPALYRRVHESLGHLMEVKNILIALAEAPDFTRFSFPYWVDERDTLPPESAALGRSLTAWVARRGVPVLVDRAELDRLESTGEVQGCGTPSAHWLGAPLLVGGEVIGVVAVQDYENPRCYAQEDVEVMTYVARAVATAIQRKRAHDELVREQSLLLTLMDSVPSFIYFKDTESRFVRVNRAAARIMGFDSPAEVVGKSDRDIYPPAVAEEIRADEQEILRTGRPILDKIERRPNPDRFVLTNKVPVIGEEGTVTRIVGVSTDVTAWRRAEEALRQSEERFRTAFESAAVGMLLVDRTGKPFRVNRALVAMLGYSAEELCSVTFADFTHPDDAPQNVAAFQEMLSGASDLYRTEKRYVRKDGGIVWAHFTASAIRDPDGAFLHSIAMVEDITERRAAEEAVRALNAELEQRVAERTAALELANKELARSNADLEQFTSVASHDLQEPLRTISTYLQLLEQRLNDELDAEGREFLDFAVDGAGRLRALIQALLAYARVGAQAVHFTATDMEAVFCEVERDLSAAVRESDGVLTHDRLPTVRADPVQLYQVLRNLVENAVKFRRDQPPRVHVSARRQNGMWLFSVEDNGAGIPPSQRDRVFTIFQRFQTTRDDGGAGIGLAICKRIVERHGGAIWFVSEPLHGSTFYFTMPADEGEGKEGEA